MRFASATAAGIVVACLAAPSAMAADVNFTAMMNGRSEVPPVATNGMGTAVATLDPRTGMLSYTVEYSRLSGTAAAAHIHGPAAAGKNAPVLFPFQNPASPIKGSVHLTPAQIQQLEAGEFYVNVHTPLHKAGEIRGQLEPMR